jgi:hypothetical protein
MSGDIATHGLHHPHHHVSYSCIQWHIQAIIILLGGSSPLLEPQRSSLPLVLCFISTHAVGQLIISIMSHIDKCHTYHGLPYLLSWQPYATVERYLRTLLAYALEGTHLTTLTGQTIIGIGTAHHTTKYCLALPYPKISSYHSHHRLVLLSIIRKHYILCK